MNEILVDDCCQICGAFCSSVVDGSVLVKEVDILLGLAHALVTLLFLGLGGDSPDNMGVYTCKGTVKIVRQRGREPEGQRDREATIQMGRRASDAEG